MALIQKWYSLPQWTYLKNRETHFKNVLACRAEFTRLGIVLQSSRKVTSGAIEIAQITVAHLNLVFRQFKIWKRTKHTRMLSLIMLFE